MNTTSDKLFGLFMMTLGAAIAVAFWSALGLQAILFLKVIIGALL